MLRSVSLSQIMGVDWSTRPAKYTLTPRVKPEDTYICVIGTSNTNAQVDAFKKQVNILYEGPMAINKYHTESTKPRQRIVVWEMKCPEPTPQDALDASKEVKIPVETT